MTTYHQAIITEIQGSDVTRQELARWIASVEGITLRQAYADIRAALKAFHAQAS